MVTSITLPGPSSKQPVSRPLFFRHASHAPPLPLPLAFSLSPMYLPHSSSHSFNLARCPPVIAKKQDKRYFQRYNDPSADVNSTEKADATDDESLLPLEEGVLTNNLGVPLIIVVNKVKIECESLLLMMPLTELLVWFSAFFPCHPTAPVRLHGRVAQGP